MNASIRQQVVKALKKHGHKDLSRAFQVVAVNLDDVLDQLVEMAAESAEIENTRDAEATPEVKREAAKFEKECEKALEEWVKKYPLAEGYDADDLMDSDGPYLILMTLMGHGVGIWDGRWDEFFNDEDKEIKALGKFLSRKLGKYADDTGGGSLPQLFEEAAFKTAAPERYAEEYASAASRVSSAEAKDLLKELVGVVKKLKPKIAKMDLDDRKDAVKLYGHLFAWVGDQIYKREEYDHLKNYNDSRLGTLIKRAIREGAPEVLPYFDKHKIDKMAWASAKQKTKAAVVKANPYSGRKPKAARTVKAKVAKKPTSKQEVIRVLVKSGQSHLANVVAGLATASGWEDKAMAELAAERGWDLEEAEWENSRYSFGNGIKIEGDGEEWTVYEAYDDAEVAAQEAIKQTIDSEGIGHFNRLFVMQHISVRPGDVGIIASEEADNYVERFDDDIMRENYDDLMSEAGMSRQWDKLVDTKDALIEKSEDTEQIEHFEQEIKDAEEDIAVQDGDAAKIGKQIQKFQKAIEKVQKEIDRASKAVPRIEKAMGAMLDDAKEKVHDDWRKKTEKALKDDPLGWYEDLTGEDLSRGGEIPSWLMVDEESLAEEVVRIDGAGMAIGYENEIELDSGAYAYSNER